MHQAIYCNDDEDAALKCLYAVALVRTQTSVVAEWECDIPSFFHM